jgi:tryptophan synthase alpha chain
VKRLQAKFQALARSGRKALIPFLTAGDPEPGFTVPMMHALVKAGADVIELGVPFSDPMADGPVIQKASERALVHKTGLRKVLAMVKQFREQDEETPVVLMGYLNPVECMGYQVFARQARDAGVDGVLTVDLPPEESEDFLPLLEAAGIDPIFLLAPNSTPERIAKVGKLGRGYLYYVSLKGVTGAAHLDLENVGAKVAEIKRLTDLPVAVGFGVKDAETARAVSKFGDGVVVGSALVAKIEAHVAEPDKAKLEIAALIEAMRHALDV